MKREDIGFVVSRGLSIWLVASALHAIVLFPNIFGLTNGSQFGRMDIQVLVCQLTVMAGDVALARILWVKADVLGRSLTSVTPSQVESAAPTKSEFGEIKSSLLSAVGLLLMVQGGSIAIERYLESDIFKGSRLHWQGYAIEAALGAFVFICYGYGDWVRKVIGTRG